MRGDTPAFLVVSNVVPWPEVSGSTIRAAATIRALADLGEVDVFCMVDAAHVVIPDPPANVRVARWKAAVIPRRPRLWRRFGWVFARGVPREVTGNDYVHPRAAFSDWVRPHYDVVWIVAGADGFEGFAALAPGPVVVNLNDVEHSKIEALLDVDSAAGDERLGLAARARHRVSRENLRVNARRWRTLYAHMAREVQAVVVCSDIDKARLDAPTAQVVPNIYPTPVTPAGRDTVGAPPTVSIIGQLHYPPNADAAEFFVRDVLPKLRQRVPDVEVRLVGEPSPSVAALDGADGVTVTGLVPDILTELGRADVCAVPLRFGGGTRIKILEAFAHRIPVVSTTLGAEGLDAVDGVHLLMADDADAFANACVTLLQDAPLRARVVHTAHAHWHERFTEDAFRRAVAAVVDVVAPRRQPS